MFRRLIPLCVVLGSLTAVPARAQIAFPSGIVPSRTALERLGLERQWFVVVPLLETERVLGISRTNDMLFAQTSHAKLHAFDAETGRRLWTASLGHHAAFARGVASNSWSVFATSADELYSLHKETGRTLWRHKVGTIITSPPACDEKRVLLGLTTGILLDFQLKKTDSKGNTTIRDIPFPLPSWHVGSAITTRPLPADRVTVIGGGDNKAHIVMADDPVTVFRVSTGGSIGEGLGAYGLRTVLVPSADYNLYAADVITAESFWVFPSGAPIVQEPMVAGEDIYIVNTAGNLTSLDPKTGKARWTTPTHGGRTAAVSARKIYLRSYNRDLFAIDRATGRVVIDPFESYLRAGLDLREYGLDIVNRFNDRIYFATDSGLVVALREIGQDQPLPLRDPKLPRFGYVPPEGLQEKYTPPPGGGQSLPLPADIAPEGMVPIGGENQPAPNQDAPMDGPDDSPQ